MRLLLRVELEEHASRVLRMDVGLRPAMAALDAAHRLDAELPNRLGCLPDVGDLKGHMMQPRATVAQEAVKIAGLIGRFEELEVTGAAGHTQPNATEPHSFVFKRPPARLSNEFGSQRQGVVDALNTPEAVAGRLDPHLVVINSPFLAIYQ